MNLIDRANRIDVARNTHGGRIWQDGQYRTVGAIGRATQFLDRDQLRLAVPSAFAGAAHSRVSDRYSFVPTESVLDGLADQGWLPVMAQEQGVRDESRKGFQKHLIRFAHRDLFDLEDRPEIVLLNSHDRSCAYQLHAGIFRAVCMNGLVVCDSTFSKISITHLDFDPSKVIEASVEICNEVPRLQNEVAEMKNLRLTEGEKQAFAEAGALLKYGEIEKMPVKPEALLVPKRIADNGDSLYQVMNVVQEHLVRGGDRPSWQERRQAQREGKRIGKTRAVAGIDGNTNLNKALWHLAEAMKKAKA